MYAHPRSDPPPKRAASVLDEVIVEDEDDAPVPLTSTAQVPVASAGSPVARLLGSSVELRLAIDVLGRLVAAPSPALGWRRVLFVVSGICLPPSRAERELREAARCLLGSVESSTLDPEKEASP